MRKEWLLSGLCALVCGLISGCTEAEVLTAGQFGPGATGDSIAPDSAPLDTGGTGVPDALDPPDEPDPPDESEVPDPGTDPGDPPDEGPQPDLKAEEDVLDPEDVLPAGRA